ncbi:MAG: hypothetical protein IKI43_06465 [Campylobacter sp.]|nr:hypothetical protein [Campylobacter sp.]
MVLTNFLSLICGKAVEFVILALEQPLKNATATLIKQNRNTFIILSPFKRFKFDKFG